MPNTRISLVIITLDEERDLPRCLSSASGFAFESIVVDSGSQDGTCRVALSCGAKVLEHDFEGFSKQKQWACEQASGDWILVLDADETASPGMESCIIKAAAARPDITAWRIRRRTAYLGRTLRFGPWMGDSPVRLFRKGSASFGEEAVHEKIRPEQGEAPVLRGCSIEHRPYEDLTEHMTKMALYCRLWAEQQAASGRRAHALDPLVRAAWRLFRGGILQLSFLDGLPGIAAAASSAVYAYWKWLLLWELTGRGSTGARGVNSHGARSSPIPERGCGDAPE
jgi:(heptosyl)LPS beta-1,4-glucosyltransferase